MREIDDRYPEYARPYAPLGRGRHHGALRPNASLGRLRRLNLSRKGFLTGVSILLILLAIIPVDPLPPPIVPPSPPPSPTAPLPTPIPPSIPTPVPVPTPTPTP